MADEELYAQAMKDLDRGAADSGLMAKAFVIAGGDVNRQKAEYIRLWVIAQKKARLVNATSDSARIIVPAVAEFVWWMAKIAAVVTALAMAGAFLFSLSYY